MAQKLDRAAVEALMSLDFLEDGTNVIFKGPTASGKGPSRKTSHTKR